jgi:hypothetical protein
MVVLALVVGCWFVVEKGKVKKEIEMEGFHV